MPRRALLLAGTLLPLFAVVFALHVREVVRTGLAQPPVFAIPGPRGDPYPQVGGLRLERRADFEALRPGDRLIQIGAVDLRGVGHVGFDAIALEQAGAALVTPVVYERAGEHHTAALHMRPYPIPWFRIPMVLSWAAAAIVVLLAAPRSRDAQLFFAACMGLAIFLTPFLGGPTLQTYAHHALFFGGGPLAIALGLVWMIRFPPELREADRLPLAVAGVAVIHPLVRLGYLVGGPLPPARVPFFAVATDMLFVAIGAGILGWNYAHANPIGRRRLKWILYAVGLWSAVAVASVAIPTMGRAFGGLAFPEMTIVTGITMVLFPAAILVSLLRYNLVDIDRLILRTASLGGTVLAASVLALLLEPRLADWIAAQTGLGEVEVRLALFAGLLAIVIPVGRAIEPWLQRAFFRSRLRVERDMQQLLADLSECRAPEDLLQLVAGRSAEILRPDACRLYVGDETRFVAAPLGRVQGPAPDFARAAALARALERHPAPLVASERNLANEVPDLSMRERDALRALGAELLLPIRRGKDLAAFVLLGPRETGDVYTGGELVLLQSIAERAGTELRRLEGDDALRRERDRARELARLRREADDANMAKTRFLAAASHDLRQPLHALGLFAQTLAEQVRDPAARETLAKLESSANALRDMLTKLLDLSRLEAGAIQPEIAPFDATPLLRRIAAEFEGAAREKGIALRAEIAATTPVRSDPVLLGRIVANLVGNAVRYTDAGSVTLRTQVRGSRVQIEIEDTGAGIPESQRLRVFEAFVRLHERKVEDGLGLGLSIVEGLAKLLGCEVTLRSEVGTGSTFAVAVPHALELPTASSGEATGSSSVAAELGGKTLIVVDDDPAALDAMRGMLVQWGCHVVAAFDAEAAIAELAARSLRPNAILADFTLRGGATGLEAIERLRAGFGREIPAVIVTGETGVAVREAIRAVGLRWLTKPVPPHKLRAMLRELLRES